MSIKYKMDGQYKLEDFGEIILRNDDGTEIHLLLNYVLSVTRTHHMIQM